MFFGEATLTEKIVRDFAQHESARMTTTFAASALGELSLRLLLVSSLLGGADGSVFIFIKLRIRFIFLGTHIQKCI